MKSLKEIALRVGYVSLWIGGLLAIAFALLFYEADLLWKVQQNNVFLDSSLFFKQSMVVPGGMLSYLGGYFTQYFYYPWLGTLFLCGWWWLLMWMVKRTFNISNRWNVLALIPVAILLIANMDLGYWVYMMKLRGYFFVPTIGVTGGVAMLWAFRKVPEKLWMRLVFIVLATLVGYPLMGAYGLAAVVLMGVMAWNPRLMPRAPQQKPWGTVLLTMTALLCAYFVPLFFYYVAYYETNSCDLYRAALPVFAVREEYPVFYDPYYVLAAFFLVMTVFSGPSLIPTRGEETKGKASTSNLTNGSAKAQMTREEKRAIRLGKKVEGKGKKPSAHTVGTTAMRWVLQGGLVVVMAWCVLHFWYKDANFHHELRMARCVENCDWEGVVEEGTKQDGEPTRAIVMMRNLALSRLGRQCQEMYQFPKGSAKIQTDLPVYMCTIAGRMMLYQYGMLNECHHSCMEEGVETGWSVELLQYMARCAILNNERQAARKFLDLLRQTKFYADWADHMETLLNDPALLAKDRETGPISRMRHYNNRLDSVNGYIERFIMFSLASQDADDLYFQEQAVLGAMWTRDSYFFWPRLEHYMELSKGDAPRIFQEAAWLFANLEGMEGLENWELESGVKESFEGFMQLMEQYHQKPSQAMQNTLLQRYGNTYYFDYFFLRNITYF